MNKLLREYVREVLKENSAPEISSLGALVRGARGLGGEIEVVLFNHEYVYKALAKRKGDEDLFNFVKDTIYESIVGYAVFGPPDKGEAYDAYEVTHMAAPGLGKVLYGMGYALSPSGLLMPDRHTVSPDASAAWKKASKERETLKLDDLPPNNKTKDPDDDAELHKEKGKEHLDYVYKELGWEKGMSSKLISRGEAAVKDLSDDVNRDKNVLIHVFFSGGTHFFRDQYSRMLHRRGLLGERISGVTNFFGDRCDSTVKRRRG